MLVSKRAYYNATVLSERDCRNAKCDSKRDCWHSVGDFTPEYERPGICTKRDACLSTEGVYCSRCVYYGKHQSFQATAGFRDYAPMLTQAQTAGQYFTNDQIKEMTRKVSAEVDLVHQQTKNQRYGSS